MGKQYSKSFFFFFYQRCVTKIHFGNLSICILFLETEKFVNDCDG